MSNGLWASRLLMSQWPNSTGAYRISEATRFSISPASAGTSEASKKAERASMQLAHFSQPKTEAPSSTGAPLRIETTEEIGNRSAFSRKETKKETNLSQPGERDIERDSGGGSLQTITSGSEFPIGVKPSPPLLRDPSCRRVRIF